MSLGQRRRPSSLRLAILVGGVGTLLALALPERPRLARRARTADVQSALKSIYARQLARHDLGRPYAAAPAELGFAPGEGDAYTYFFDDPSACAPAPAADTAARPDEAAPAPPAAPPAGPCSRTSSARAPSQAPDAGQRPDAPASPLVAPLFVPGTPGRFLVTAAANLDDDDDLDSWSVSSEFRRGGARSGPGTCAMGDTPAGQPCHDQDDVR